MDTFNILHGFPEALVRGMRSGFLGDADYHHLTQCETLDDVRLNLSESDYAAELADTTSISPTGLQAVAVEKLGLRVGALLMDPRRRTLLHLHHPGKVQAAAARLGRLRQRA